MYRSYDLSLGREVAIKELDESGRRDPRHRERFLREAQFLAQFEHDNVLRVYSVDPERGWIVMELMKGTLASMIADGPSDPDLVRSVLKQTLDALAFLHEKNKVHGTVRPTNLLINDMGRVKLSEFEQTAVGGELRVPNGQQEVSGARADPARVRRVRPADSICIASDSRRSSCSRARSSKACSPARAKARSTPTSPGCAGTVRRRSSRRRRSW